MLENNITLPSQSGAMMYVMKLLNQMNTKFCKKHNFIVQENNNDFIIALDQSRPVSNCCGNGCCG